MPITATTTYHIRAHGAHKLTDRRALTPEPLTPDLQSLKFSRLLTQVFYGLMTGEIESTSKLWDALRRAMGQAQAGEWARAIGQVESVIGYR